MHDRRLNGETLTFGNQGALFMTAMTWWDHGTGSIWSQPWGAAIGGELEGESLTLLPAEIVPWSTWLNEHPETTALVDERGIDAPLWYPDEKPRDGFVIGVSIGDSAVAYHYPAAEEALVVNDKIGELPIVVLVDPETRSIESYLRIPAPGLKGDFPEDAPDVVTFVVSEGGIITDEETGSVWDRERGAAISGPLAGAQLQQVPYITSFDWAWKNFFPESRFWPGERTRAGYK